MSIGQIKNLQRRLENLLKEASEELDKECGHELWRHIGFEAVDRLEDSNKRAKANFYYAQWLTAREIQESIG